MLGDSREARLFLEGFLHSFPYFVCYLPMALPSMLSFKSNLAFFWLALRTLTSWVSV